MASLRRIRGLAMAALSALLAGCTDAPPVVPEPPTVTVQTPHVWSGTEALLTSPAFAGTPDADLPAVYLADSLLAVRRVDDTTLAVQMPEMNGAADLRLQTGGGTVFLDPIHVHGFRGSRDGPVLGGHPFVWPRPGMPWMIGHGVTSLVIADIRDNSVQAFSADVHRPWCMWAPGIDARDPTRLLVRDGPPVSSYTQCAGPLRVWQAPPPGIVLDTLTFQFGTPWLLLRTADSAFVTVYDNWVVARGPSGTDWIWGEGAYGLRWSEGGRRVATFGIQKDSAGIAIFDGAAGRIAYRIPSLLGPEAAAFSDDGDTLFLVGSAEPGGRRTLVKALSATGTIVRSESIDGRPVYDMALDPTANLLYLLRPRLWPSDPTEVDVIDRSTLALVTRLVAPGGGSSWVSRLVFDQIHRRLCVLSPSWDFYDIDHPPTPRPSIVLEFELMP